jgi:hypothetical protein
MAGRKERRGTVRCWDFDVRFIGALGACFGAGDGIRTRDINLGKVALYQLSYSRIGRPEKATAFILSLSEANVNCDKGPPNFGENNPRNELSLKCFTTDVVDVR